MKSAGIIHAWLGAGNSFPLGQTQLWASGVVSWDCIARQRCYFFPAGYELTAAVDDFDLGKLGLLRGTVLAVHRQAVVNRAKPINAARRIVPKPSAWSSTPN
ncbi:MAG: hypothetical protein HOB97_01220 [Verrucomicrobia bacterium]|nr:hypothetical protein [Verrucomicrobiota bacterium]MBT4901106.1 hypothetical protein [Verrucomicrobiota bacterium]MBT6659016.1 hypothetical protein [Verrucomicrobiota bacterium]